MMPREYNEWGMPNSFVKIARRTLEGPLLEIGREPLLWERILL